MNIQWYPGHMTKTRRMMEVHIKLVDMVIELLDARMPLSSKNPDIDKLAASKPRLIILTKSDIADADMTARWAEYFRAAGFFTLAMDLTAGKQKASAAQLSAMVEKIMADKLARQAKKGRLAIPVRAMVAGIPNVGKSTFINMLAGRAATHTADRPGVTRGRQWIAVRPAGKTRAAGAFGGFDLMDTPGVLWPKFEDPEVGMRLAVTGAVSDTILDKITLAEHLIEMLETVAPTALNERYKIGDRNINDDNMDSNNTDNDNTDSNNIDNDNMDSNNLNNDSADGDMLNSIINPRAVLTEIGAARGYKMKGNTVDLERTAIMLLDEFRGGKLGRITLEAPPG